VVLRLRSTGRAGNALKGRRPAYFAERGGFVETAVYDRDRLAVGDEIPGPAVVEEEGSTLVVGPDTAASVAPTGNLIVTLAPRGSNA
jgi:N-methylhydantoinase A